MGQGQSPRRSPLGTLSEYANGKIVKPWNDGNAYRIELKDDEQSNVWARSDMNTYVGARDQRFMNSLTKSLPCNGEVTVSTVFSWRMGIEAIVGHRKILMLMLGLLVNKFY